jgi:hypothetical protein
LNLPLCVTIQKIQTGPLRAISFDFRPRASYCQGTLAGPQVATHLSATLSQQQSSIVSPCLGAELRVREGKRLYSGLRT